MTRDDAITLFRELPEMVGQRLEALLRMREDGEYVVEVRCTERGLRALTDFFESLQRPLSADERVYNGVLDVRPYVPETPHEAEPELWIVLGDKRPDVRQQTTG